MANVSLISYTPDPEMVIAQAAKLCYSSVSPNKIKEVLTKENTAKFINMLSKIGHESPIEHVSFTFSVEGVSRALLAQITRHRIASYSVRSQRYVNESMFEYIIPPKINDCEEAKKIFLKAMEEDKKHYDELVEVLLKKHKKNLIRSGIEESKVQKIAEKKAMEDARFVLPNACSTNIICTFNARSLNNFFALRCCNRAQWEIREVATKMLKLVLKVAPNLFCSSGPSCVRGTCKEGKMTCGKAKETSDFFKSLRENI